MKTLTSKLEKYQKEVSSVDYGLKRDWQMRIKDSLVFYEGSPFYVMEIISIPNEALRKKEEDLLVLHRESSSEVKRDLLAKKILKLREELKKPENSLLVARGSHYQKKAKAVNKDVPVGLLDLALKRVGLVNRYFKINGQPRSSAVYCSRGPFNQTKQGISRRNIKMQAVGFSNNLYDATDFEVTHKDFIAATLGAYPSIDEALEKLFSLRLSNSLAVSPLLSLSVDEVGHATLNHNTRHIGSFCPDTKTVDLLSRYAYLKETLEEIGMEIKPND